MSTQKDAGGIDGIRTIPELVARLSPFFASSSLFQPPGASPSQTGSRTIAVTSANNSATPVPGDSQRAALVAGTYTWTFATKFNKPPVVTVTAEGAPPSSGTTLFLAVPASNTTVIIQSTDPTDVRILNIVARGNPN